MPIQYINYPNWISPQIVPFLPVRWYGLMYLLAFATAYLLMLRQQKKGLTVVKHSHIYPLTFWIIIGLLLGARIFSTLIYAEDNYYIENPWFILFPWNPRYGFGLQGMSYHGGVVGGILGTFFFSRRYRYDWFELMDLATVAIPLGFTFGRLGNFINGELWGKVSTLPFAMIFPNADRFPVSLPWVRETAGQLGMLNDEAGGAFINLPRHPSQLYEALFEGVVLWLLLWFLFRPRQKTTGAIFSLYLTGFGLFRFIIEYFRQPDPQLGYILNFSGNTELSIYYLESLLAFSMGQLLCFLMIVAGLLVYLYCRCRRKRIENR